MFIHSIAYTLCLPFLLCVSQPQQKVSNVAQTEQQITVDPHIQKIDSLITLSNTFKKTDSLKFRTLMNLVLELSKTHNYVLGTFEYNSNLQQFFYYQQQYDSAFYYADKAIAIAKKHQFNTKAGQALYNKAYINGRLSKYPEAIKHYLEAITWYEKDKDYKRITKCYQNIGVIYEELKLNTLAEEMTHKAISFAEKENDTVSLYLNIGNLAALQLENDKLDSAQYNFNRIKAYEPYVLKSKSSYVHRMQVSEYYTLANYYNEKKQYKEGLTYAKAALSIVNDKSLGVKEQAMVYTVLGTLYQKTEAYNTAIDYYKKVKDIGENYNSALYKSEAYKGLSYCYTAIGNYKKANTYAIKYMPLNDELNSQENAKLISNHLAFYDSYKKDLEITAKDLEIAKNKIVASEATSKLERKTAQYTILILVIIVISALILGFWQYKYRKRVQANNKALKMAISDKEKALQRLTFLLSTLSHQIKTPIHGILGFSNLLHQEDLSDSTKTTLKQINLSCNQLLHYSNAINEYEGWVKNKTFNATDKESTVLDVVNETQRIIENTTKINHCSYTQKEDHLAFIAATDLILAAIKNSILYTENTNFKTASCNISAKTVDSNHLHMAFTLDVPMTKAQYQQTIQYLNTEVLSDNEKDLMSYQSGSIHIKIAQKQLEQLGTTLDLSYSESDNSTLGFELHLQRVAPQQIETTSERSMPNECSILLIDDDKLSLLVSKKLLETNQYCCDIELLPQKALDTIASKDYDLVITDLMMPEMDGFQLAKAIKDMKPNQKIAALSAMDYNAITDKIEESGIDFFISKPLDVEKLNPFVTKLK